MTSSNISHHLAFGASILALTLCSLTLSSSNVLAQSVKADANTLKPAKAPAPVAAKPAPVGPLIAVVSIANQRISVYNRSGKITGSSVSSGQSGFETPQGIFSVIAKEKEHFSNLYDDAPMPNMQRITWSGVALHAGNLPGYPASHGCIRLSHDFSAKLFALTKMGTRVIVARNDVVPVNFSHPRLFTPKLMEGANTAAGAPLENTKEGQTFEPSSVPMMLGASSVSMTDRMGDKLDAAAAAAAAAKPVGLSLSAAAAIAAKEAREADKIALAAKNAAAIRTRDSDRATADVVALEKARSIAAAKLTGIEAAIAKGAKTPEAQQKLEDAKTAAEARLAELLAQTDAARVVALDREFEAFEAEDTFKTVTAVKIVATNAARDAARKLQPISVFVSRKTNRLYVRQGFVPVFDVPVTIANPDQAVGTHVYTVMDRAEDGKSVKWSAVTVLGGPTETPKPRKGETAAPQRSALQTAAGALDRVEMPKEAIDRISELLTPGSSLIISDKGISNETGKGTDFVILTR
jgi:L,D-transpeptidase catalytic domain